MSDASDSEFRLLSPAQLSCGGVDCHRFPIACETLLNALDQGPQAVALFDPTDLLAYGNSAFRSAWSVESGGHPSFASILRSCYSKGVGAIVDTDDIEAWIAAAILRRRTGQDFRAFEVDFFDGRWFWITEKRLPDDWILFIGQDITPLKNNEQSLRAARDVAIKASLTDPLTQLSNRRHALQQLHTLFMAKADFYLAMIDIDHFKKINDKYGHAAGDAVLISISTELQKLEFCGCRVARLAGDEFSIISPLQISETDFGSILSTFSRSCASIDVAPQKIAISMSIGVSRSLDDGTTVEELLAASDVAMYWGKQNGRSMIQFFRSTDMLISKE